MLHYHKLILKSIYHYGLGIIFNLVSKKVTYLYDIFSVTGKEN